MGLLHMIINRIFRCFISTNYIYLLKSYITYIRPILEHNSSICNPSIWKYIYIFIYNPHMGLVNPRHSHHSPLLVGGFSVMQSSSKRVTNTYKLVIDFGFLFTYYCLFLYHVVLQYVCLHQVIIQFPLYILYIMKSIFFLFSNTIGFLFFLLINY